MKILLLMLLTVNVYGQEKIVSSAPNAYTYVIYVSSLTKDDEITLTNIRTKTQNNLQPYTRFQWIYNSTAAVCKYGDSKDESLKRDSSTTRAVISIETQSDVDVKSWVALGKAKCLYSTGSRTMFY